MRLSNVPLAGFVAVILCIACGGATEDVDLPSGVEVPPETCATFAEQIVQGTGGGVANRCFPRRLIVGAAGAVPCSVLEEQPPGACGCDSPGRLPASSSGAAAARDVMARTGRCGGSTDRSCADICFCEIEQLAGVSREQCRTSPVSIAPGFCYIDPEQGIGDFALLEQCAATEKRLLRFSGEGTPRNAAVTVIACFESDARADSGSSGAAGVGARCPPSD